MRCTLTYLLVFLSGLNGWTQSNLGVMSADGALFQIMLDDKVVSQDPDSVFKVFDLDYGTYTLAVNFTNGVTVNKPIYLENDTEHWFEVEVDSVNSKIRFYNTFPTSQTDTISVGRTLINARNGTLPEPADIVADTNSTQPTGTTTQVSIVTDENGRVTELDSTARDSIAKLDFSVTYQGTRGCESPLSDFDARLAGISDEEFNSRRLKKVKSIFDGQCITVDQVAAVLSLFEFEDHKLEVIRSLKTNIFDLDNLGLLSAQFQLSRNLKKFHTLTGLE